MLQDSNGAAQDEANTDSVEFIDKLDEALSEETDT